MRSLAAFLVVLMIWGCGLLAFAARVERSTPAPEPEAADAIVVLTGVGSSQRIPAGMRLLEEGKAKRMLVSGVNRDATREDIRVVGKGARRLYDCCVDLGFTAANTLGNAEETAEWARKMGFTRIILVTADYHMPRSHLELKAALPEATITAFPVATPTLDAKRWWRSGRGARLMVLEYSKYLAILGREAVLGLGPKEQTS